MPIGQPAVAETVGGGWPSRLAWSALSQGASSATNFGLLVGLTLLAPPAHLGRLVAASSIYLLALTLSRAAVTDPLVAAAGADDGPSWRRARIAIVRLGLLAVAVGVGAGWALGLRASDLVLLVGPVPILLVQDGQRGLAWATGRPVLAATLDLVWLVVGGVFGVTAAVAAGGPTPTVIIGAWVAGGLASWAFGRVLVEGRLPTRLAARPVDGGAEPRSTGRYRGLALSQATYAGAFNLLPVVMALAVSSEAAAVLKALVLPFAPILSVVAGLRVVTLPVMRRAADRGEGAAVTSRIVAVGSVVAAGGAATVAGVVGQVPAELVGPSVTAVRPLLGWGAALTVMFVVAQLLADGRALAAPAGSVVRRRLAAVGLEWAFLLTGTVLGGVAGLAQGWAIGLALATVIWLAPMGTEPATATR